jgi:hypothetical protein
MLESEHLCNDMFSHVITMLILQKSTNVGTLHRIRCVIDLLRKALKWGRTNAAGVNTTTMLKLMSMWGLTMLKSKWLSTVVYKLSETPSCAIHIHLVVLLTVPGLHRWHAYCAKVQIFVAPKSIRHILNGAGPTQLSKRQPVLEACRMLLSWHDSREHEL